MSRKKIEKRARAGDEDNRVENSTGNVFKDMDLPDPQMRLAKARLAQHVARLIKSQGLSQQQAAKKLGIDQPKVSAILRGRLKDFAPYRLMSFILRLDQDVIISVGDPLDEARPSVRVLVGA